MNNVFYKVYNHKKLEGNILILVILVMLTVSMMGLLTMSILKQMFSYTINLDGYYKSYYLSKAGLELALTEIDNVDVGFSNVISGTDTIFTRNLCPSLDCSVSMNIQGRTNFLSEKFWEDSNSNTCNNPIVLSGGESFALPLFLQSGPLSDASILGGDTKQYTSIVPDLSKIVVNPKDNVFGDTKLNLSLVFQEIDDQLNNLYISSEDFDSDMIKNWPGIKSLDQYSSSKLYLMISNLNAYPVWFCLSINGIMDSRLITIPATKFYVVSLGNYQGKYVGMQAVYAQPIPSFMFYGYDGHGSAIIRSE